MPAKYPCGPLEVLVSAGTELLRSKLAEQLSLFNVGWTRPLEAVDLEAMESDAVVAPCRGTYLDCARMSVDQQPTGLVATTPSGAWCRQRGQDLSWRIGVPRGTSDPWVLIDIESLLTLVLTVGWRRLGWVPLHAAAVVRDRYCAIICAESGGGKTTLTAALVRSGWRTLGDDKLLLRLHDTGSPSLRALVHTFNLHPKTRQWFPEVGDLETLPIYSEWTEKRKVRPETIWPDSTAESATPTHLVQLHRERSRPAVRIEEMSPQQNLGVLLRQTVIPADRDVARSILDTVAKTTTALAGLRVLLGEDIYRDPDSLGPLQARLS